jgi:hypothetical protein
MRLISAGSLVRVQSGPPGSGGYPGHGNGFANAKAEFTILRFGESLKTRNRPPYPQQADEVFFDICILGRKYNFGEQKKGSPFFLSDIKNNQATKGV